MRYLAENETLLKKMGFPTDKDSLKALCELYPWYTTARMVYFAQTGEPDHLLSLRLLSAGIPPSLLKPIPQEEFEKFPPENSPEEIIDNFLAESEHKIVPSEEITDYDAAEESSKLDIPEELLTKELAEIYMKQGLTQEAEEIYRILEKREAGR